jgi:hypothetical protein
MSVATIRNLERNGALQIYASTSTELFEQSSYLDAWYAGVGSTVTELAAVNSSNLDVTVTDATTGFVKIPIPEDDNIAFVVSWAASSTQQYAHLHVSPGQERMGWQQGQGGFTVALEASGGSGQGKRYLVGPFESARFARVSRSTDNGVGAGSSDIGIGKKFVRFFLSVTTSEDGVHGQFSVAPFRMPRVTYSA